MGVFIALFVCWLAYYLDKRAEKRQNIEQEYPNTLNEILYGSRPKQKTIHISATITTSDPDIKFNSDNTVSINAKASDLFTDAFIRSCSSFNNWSAFCDSHFPPDIDLNTVPLSELDAFIKANTTYPDWISMLLAASKQWTTAKYDIENPDVLEITAQTTVYKK